MKFSILTLFPEVIQAYASASIMGRAIKSGVIAVEAINIRDFSADPHHKVDDSPFGGGGGMVMTCQPVESAFESLLPLQEPARVLLTTPTGRRFDHAMAVELSECKHLVMLCGHYEGFDDRIKTLIPQIEEVSIGDYVLTGGELPALSMMDAVTRLLPGAVQKFSSVEADSFYDGLLDYPHYTRPAEYKGLKVPDVLLSGNHAAIAKWRKEQSLQKTRQLRPDLLE
jgi:tRNA (guanine37-N1)-methyltransferase